jgi:hypothetical protein
MQIEFDYYLSPDGDVHNLHDFDARAIMSHDGYGMPPLEWHTSRAPFLHGETALDYRLRPRNIRLIVHWKARSRQDYWDKRAELLDAIRPNRSATASPGILRKVLPNGDIRDIEVQLLSGPSFGPERPDRWEEWSFEEVVQFTAWMPTFFDPAQQTYAAAPLVGVGNIVCPGTWRSWPVIEYVGPITDPVITNTTIGEAITLTYAIPNGRTVAIALTPGLKTVTDDLGVNLIGYVTGDLATWRLEVDPIAADGINQIQFAVGWSAAPAAMNVYWYDHWIGI